MNLSGYITLWH